MFDIDLKGCRVFMTGHTGFKGSWLTLWLSRLGAIVRGYAIEPPSTPSMFELLNLEGCCDSVYGDIRNGAALKKALADFSPDIVIHMAAQPLVRRSYVEPAETFDTNVMGTVNVMEAVRGVRSVRVVINVTSDKCYENNGTGEPFTEADPMGGADPYSASKGCAELVARAWGRSFFQGEDVKLASVRAGNVIGGGDFGEDRLLPDMARAFSKSEPVHIRSPKAVRPWQFVLEPLSGYLTLASRMLSGEDYSGGWNFGPDERDTQTVGEVVEGVVRRWGGGAASTMDEGDHPHEAAVLRLSCAKAREQLGWTPRTDIETALDWSVEWYSAWSRGTVPLLDLTGEQISRFEAM